ncbi:flagellar hook-associated protein FlgL [Sulfidibacter corallicola]|uniref:Flagellin N-terminal domain-containing protein n=1 Tax=Sulfidibacter corallicola TaxID=2818388 RepID=A0A8A4TX86_SULCO|nr:flagellin [Sulfidibacter corallicola]QTD53947.1 hypothetical protein J3U87_15975 [Sulfidibacter corallicola]
MVFRLGEFANDRQFLLYNQRSNFEQSQILEHISTLKKVNRGSDDPVNFSRIESTRDQLEQNAAFEKNIETLLQKNGVIESSLNSILESFEAARELAVQGTSHLHDDLERETIADQIQQHRESIINRLNTRHEDEYLFSGTLTTTQPFDAAGVYSGNTTIVNARINDTDTIQTNFIGSDLAYGPTGPGDPTDIIEILTNLETAFRANDEVAINAELPRMRDVTERLNEAIAEVGTRNVRLTAENDRYAVFEENLTTVLAQLEAADLAEEIVDLEQVQNTLQAQLRSQGTINQQSLLNFLG